MSRIQRLAPYFIIGPISGPLLAGVVINFRERRPVLGAMYAVALLEYAVVLSVLVARVGVHPA